MLLGKNVKGKSRYQVISREPSESLGPKDWEERMMILSYSHKDIKWRKHNLIVGNQNQAAYKKLNLIRYSISEVSPDIIGLIPSARWLFDNFQMLYREIKKVKTTGTSYEMLPILQSGTDKGVPRIYVVAREMISLTGGYLNEENISMMIRAYQKNLTLSDKELWILPEMLGLVLLKQIIDVSEDIVHIIQTKYQADNFVKERLKVKTGQMDIAPLLQKLSGDCDENFSFHCHVIYLLKNMSIEDDSIQRYIDYHCDQEGHSLNPAEIFKEEGKFESFLESKIRTLIVSLREINQLDEEKLFEDLSLLEHILLQDPAGIYPDMDAESRGVYRQIAEKLALKYKLEDSVVGEACLGLAEEGHENLNCANHVGTYLIGKGYPILKAKVLGRRPPDSLQHKNYKGLYYAVFATATLVLICFLLYDLLLGCNGGLLREGVILLISIPIIIGITMDVSNNLFLRLIPVKKIPSMDYLKEVPDEARTIVVMPVIVSSAEQGLIYLERLHNHYLANRQANLYFALLADYADAPELTMPEDEPLTRTMMARLRELNDQYPSPHQKFSLFFRYRKWNEAEGYYMCWERKRGKLEEFNAWLTGTPQEETSFSLLMTDSALRGTFKYVITLDADSMLIRDNAAKLVGMIDHPLNHAVLDAEKRKVEEGFAIIQPTVRNHINDRGSSAFPKIIGGQDGLVHYSSVISDIYQDIFQEGSYIGKGIYNVEVFHQVLHQQIPENKVLSHDLLESSYVKTAFTGAANIMDDFPGTVLSYAKREHRWIRGDWQLLPWLLKSDKISMVSRWKIFDNLRRSLIPLCKLLLILLNLILLPCAWYLWIPIVFFSDVMGFVILLTSVVSFKIKRPKLAVVQKHLWADVRNMAIRSLTEIVLIPYKAYTAADAILRTLYRLTISKKGLLMWNPSDNVEKTILNTRKGYFLHMWNAMIPAGIIAALLFFRTPSLPGIVVYAVLAAAWACSFLVAWKISQPVDKTPKPQEEDLLRETARRTWRFFKDFASKENNWLCPDNYQITTKRKVTGKTSPTNIGLQFLSILSAKDFGFETLSSTLDNIENLLYSVVTLDKWNGHLYNWYNIKTLTVLPPEYISTVDSGNFFGHLITLKNGLLEQKKNPILTESLLAELDHQLRCSGKEPNALYALDTYGDFAEALASDDSRAAGNGRSADEFRGTEDLNQISEEIRKEIQVFALGARSLADRVTLEQLAAEKQSYAAELTDKIDSLCEIIDNLVRDADFTPLYSQKRMLFHIGYHVSSKTTDAGCYDLISSESLLTSFLAIARGEVPVKHWYKLARPLTMVNGVPAFVSWSGTMFEYLMPSLVLREYDGSVFSQSWKAAVMQHINYGASMHIPWGISESQYYRFDLDSNYQYKAFGVPELRLQPSVSNSLVVAPYATVLALEFASEEAQNNMKKLKDLGAFGEYGFYESLDFNAPDPVELTPYCIVKSFMAHHQGMNLVAIDNFLNHGIMRRRFHAEPIVKATEVLLEEKRQSYFISITKRGYTVNLKKMGTHEEDVLGRRYIKRVSPVIPACNYLSNNKYSLMITSDGDGFSHYMGTSLYRWRADRYANTGSYIYIKELKEGRVWSAAYHPTKAEPDEYQAIFSPHEAEFRRRDGDISTYLQVCVSPTRNVEIRKVTFTNHGKQEKQLEVTSYLEVVGDRYMAELSHPAFNKLFIESEYEPESGVLLSRRRSAGGEQNPYIMHVAKSGGKPFTRYEYENDRLKFIGRNNTLENPAAVMGNISLTNQAGFSNDPIMSLRAEISLGPEETVSLSFLTGVCDSKEEAVKISNEFSIGYRIDDQFEKARLQSEMELKYLNITRQQVNAFQDLVSPIFYPSSYYRGPVENIRRNWKNQSFLWRFGVSGDNPIMLLRISSVEEIGIARDVLKAYEYLRINQVKVDLIILSEAKHGYMQELSDLLNEMTSSMKIYDEDRERPSLFILHSYQMIPAEVDLLFTVARVVFSEQTGIYFRSIKETVKETDEE